MKLIIRSPWFSIEIFSTQYLVMIIIIKYIINLQPIYFIIFEISVIMQFNLI